MSRVVIPLAMIVTSVVSTGILFFAALEGWERWRHPATESEHLVYDAELGWDSHPAVESLPLEGATLDVYFIGDSFTDEKSWYRYAQESARDGGLRVSAHSLGVSGFGVTQSMLKLRRHFEDHEPEVVVLLVFAWNDMRDDYPYPQIFYNPARHARPYAHRDASGAVSYPLRSSLFLRSQAYVRHFLPAVLKLTDRVAAWDIDFFGRWRLSPMLSYESRAGWSPFYDPARAGSAYVEGAYAGLEHALVEIRDFTRERGASLIVLALDNAFSIDRDVSDRWIDSDAGLDVGLPLRRLARIAEAHGIRFVDVRPALLREQQRLGGKIYLGREGDIAGHLSEAGERVVGETAAAELLGLRRYSHR
jgi:hypothetical protein